MRKKDLRLYMKRAILMMAPLFFVACEKPEGSGELGFNQVIGSTADVNTVSYPVKTYTQSLDSVLVALAYDEQLLFGGYLGNRLVGTYNDPSLGSNKASIVSQVILNQVNIDFGTNPVIDSVNLFLQYSGHYGDTSENVSFLVNEIDAVIDRDTLIYSNYPVQIGQEIGRKDNFQLRPNSSTPYDGDDLIPTLIIPMDVNFFQQKIADVADGSFASFESNEDFIEYFKGIHISATSAGRGPIAYFSLAGTNSRMIIYYHNDDEDSLSTELNFQQNKETVPISFGVFDQDYSGVSLDPDNPDSTLGEDVTYIQSLGGVMTVVDIPDLDTLIEKGFVINGARLQIPLMLGTGNGAPPANTLEVRKIEDNDAAGTIIDFRAGVNTGDGALRLGDLRDNKYIFDLSRHVFDVANGASNLKLGIVPVNKGTTANQTVLQGSTSLSQNLSLIVYYTKP